MAALAGLALGVGQMLGPVVFALLAVRPDNDDFLYLLWVVLATIVGFCGGWALCLVLLTRASVAQPMRATWWAWGIAVAVSLVVNAVVGGVAIAVGVMSVALLWSGDQLGAITGIALAVSGTVVIVTCVLVTMATARRAGPGVSASTPYG